MTHQKSIISKYVKTLAVSVVLGLAIFCSAASPALAEGELGTVFSAINVKPDASQIGVNFEFKGNDRTKRLVQPKLIINIKDVSDLGGTIYTKLQPFDEGQSKQQITITDPGALAKIKQIYQNSPATSLRLSLTLASDFETSNEGVSVLPVGRYIVGGKVPPPQTEAVTGGASGTGPVAADRAGAPDTATGGGDKAKSADDRVKAPTEFGPVTDLGAYADNIMRYILPLGVALAVIMTMYAGIIFMTSQGQPDRIKDAQEIITGAVMGLVILILARLLMGFFFLPSAAQAAAPDFGFEAITEGLPRSNFEGQPIGQLLQVVFDIVSVLVIGLALIGMIVSGMMFITAGSDSDKANTAKKNMLWVISGILIYMLSLYAAKSLRVGIEDQVVAPSTEESQQSQLDELLRMFQLQVGERN